MAINTVQAVINGQTHNLILNNQTGKHEATITAPNTSSYPLSGHYYPVTIVATDVAGNTTTKDPTDATLGESLKLKVKESVKPIITVVSPTTGSVLTNNKPTFEWKVEDADSGIDTSTIKIKIDNGSVATPSNTTAITNGYQCTYTPIAALADGSHTIIFTVSDNDGNVATAVSITITIDTVPPTLNVTSPAQNSVTNNPSCVVSGITNDVSSSPVTVNVNGQSVSVGSDGAFSTTVTLAEGTNTITVVATDSAGKTTTVTRAVTLDTSAPVISAVTITPNPVGTGDSYIISVTVSD